MQEHLIVEYPGRTSVSHPNLDLQRHVLTHSASVEATVRVPGLLLFRHLRRPVGSHASKLLQKAQSDSNQTISLPLMFCRLSMFENREWCDTVLYLPEATGPHWQPISPALGMTDTF
jgi:hypothetical protein